ncbi:hypothetical protein BJ875DRAFT_514216 [Amylocarpus encephaloides]|uniref:Uncharacterized protein n=1 Tax=Amylocarpus encephaloides TaxID=45428 RepID=A0A9P7YFR5_9HELO|nr:hypothetical protein BJ875DRAFT_514216 [Amylocarpus encephaloides]
MNSASESTVGVNTGILSVSDTVQPYIQKAMNKYHFNLAATPVSLFVPTNRPKGVEIQPKLSRHARNNILLAPGSFNPPTKRRHQFNIVAWFTFADPDDIVLTREKKYGDIILPQQLRYKMFAQVPELALMIASGWLHLLLGDMDGHIEVLRSMTDLIKESELDVKLVGFLGGDKLSMMSEPHLPSVFLTEWGPVDEFMIVNARRPVDFYSTGRDSDSRSGRPIDIPGCTKWEREVQAGDLEIVTEQERSLGVLWVCKALTVPGQPVIRFRASESSASNGISSTKIRQIMSESPDEELYEMLRDKVFSVELLVEWMLEHRKGSQTEALIEKLQ